MPAIIGAALLLLQQPFCLEARITGYSRFEHGTHTYDGTSILTDEAIAAGSWNLPLGWYVDVPDVGVFRIADRGGGLGSTGWIDIAVWSRSEAFALTSVRQVCVYPPGGDRASP